MSSPRPHRSSSRSSSTPADGVLGKEHETRSTGKSIALGVVLALAACQPLVHLDAMLMRNHGSGTSATLATLMERLPPNAGSARRLTATSR